jgi:transcriptional regulator with XRE-family HTH domain
MQETPFRIKVGEKILAAREKKNLRQEDLAYIIRTSRTSITNTEKGRQILPINKLALLCLVLDLKMDDLIDWDVLKAEVKRQLEFLQFKR